jgi:hypothetical protein
MASSFSARRPWRSYGTPRALWSCIAPFGVRFPAGSLHALPLEQFMFGSVAVWLVERSACPVAVVPLSTALRPEGSGPWTHHTAT